MFYVKIEKKNIGLLESQWNMEHVSKKAENYSACF